VLDGSAQNAKSETLRGQGQSGRPAVSEARTWVARTAPRARQQRRTAAWIARRRRESGTSTDAPTPGWTRLSSPTPSSGARRP